MKFKLMSATVLVWFSAVFLFALGGARAQAADSSIKVAAALVWATDCQSTNKPVEADIKEWLTQKLPLKWTNYFEISQKVLVISQGQTMKAVLSQNCTVEIKNLEKSSSTIELGLFSRGAQVVRRNQTLPRGNVVGFGGNALNATGWLVVLKRLE